MSLPRTFLLRLSISAAGAMKFAHETRERFDGFEGDGVVERDAHASNGAVPGGANQTGSGGFLGELLFEVFVPAAHAEDHVHLRTRTVLDREMIKAAA